MAVFSLGLLLNLIVYKRIGFELGRFLSLILLKTTSRLKSHGIYWVRFAFILTPYLTFLLGLIMLKKLIIR